MDMIGHQAIGGNLRAGLFRCRPEQSEIGAVIALLKEDRLTAVAPLGDMMRDARDHNTCKTSHVAQISCQREHYKNINSIEYWYWGQFT